MHLERSEELRHASIKVPVVKKVLYGHKDSRGLNHPVVIWGGVIVQLLATKDRVGALDLKEPILVGGVVVEGERFFCRAPIQL